MKEDESTSKKINFWERPIFSGISLFLGLMLTATNIIYIIKQQNKTSFEIEKIRSENEKINQELKQLEPSFKVQYVSMSEEIFNNLGKKNSEESDGFIFWNSPVFELDKNFSIDSNNVNWKNQEFEEGVVDRELLIKEIKKGKISSNDMTREINCLVVVQDGKRRADDVEIEIDQISLNKIIEIFDNSDLAMNYWENGIPESTGKTLKKNFRLGSFDPGNSLIIPLFYTYYLSSNAVSARVAQGSIYLPKKLFFLDPITGQRREYPIRKMLENSITINAYIKMRG